MRRLCFCITLLFIKSLSFGQSIPLDSFFTVGTTWTEAVNWSYMPSGASSYSTGSYAIVYRIERDTIIGSSKHHLVSVSTKAVYTYPSSYSSAGGHWGAYGAVVGRIRTVGSKVYFTRTISTSDYNYSGFPLGVECLIYDYSLPVGSHFMSINGGIDIGSIDSGSLMLSTGDTIKKYNDTSEKYWLEGIGSSLG